MAETPPPPGRPASNDELLDSAIPIPADELEEDLPDAVQITDDDHVDASQADSHGDDELAPLDMAESSAASAAGRTKIHGFSVGKAKDVVWKRKTVNTGAGACHMKTFVAKLRMESMEHLDEQVNAWLDEHPDYEVKFAQTTVGELRGKTVEPALVLTVWV